MQADLSTKTKSNIRTIGWYQIIGGGLGVLILLYSLFTIDQIVGLNILVYGIMFLFFGFSVICGALCLNYDKKALQYSLINQFLQLISLAILGFAFSYAAGIYFALGLDFTKSFELTFNIGVSKFDFNINREHGRIEINLNLVALGLIYWIDRLIKRSKAEKLSLLIAEMGQP